MKIIYYVYDKSKKILQKNEKNKKIEEKNIN